MKSFDEIIKSAVVPEPSTSLEQAQKEIEKIRQVLGFDPAAVDLPGRTPPPTGETLFWLGSNSSVKPLKVYSHTDPPYVFGFDGFHITETGYYPGESEEDRIVREVTQNLLEEQSEADMFITSNVRLAWNLTMPKPKSYGQLKNIITASDKSNE